MRRVPMLLASCLSGLASVALVGCSGGADVDSANSAETVSPDHHSTDAGKSDAGVAADAGGDVDGASPLAGPPASALDVDFNPDGIGITLSSGDGAEQVSPATLFAGASLKVTAETLDGQSNCAPATVALSYTTASGTVSLPVIENPPSTPSWTMTVPAADSVRFVFVMTGTSEDDGSACQWSSASAYPLDYPVKQAWQVNELRVATDGSVAFDHALTDEDTLSVSFPAALLPNCRGNGWRTDAEVTFSGETEANLLPVAYGDPASPVSPLTLFPVPPGSTSVQVRFHNHDVLGYLDSGGACDEYSATTTYPIAP